MLCRCGTDPYEGAASLRPRVNSDSLKVDMPRQRSGECVGVCVWVCVCVCVGGEVRCWTKCLLKCLCVCVCVCVCVQDERCKRVGGSGECLWFT